MVAHINIILFLNDFLQFHECHHLYFPLPERAELESECNNSLDCIPTNCIYKLRFEPSSFTNLRWDGFLIWCYLWWWLPYLLVYKSTSCISRPTFSRSKIEFLIILGKQMKFTPIKISQNVNLFFPENVLKTQWIKKSRGLIICSEVYQDHNVRT